MKTTTRHLTLAALALLIFTPSLAPAAGPVSELYLTAGDQTRLLRIQGSTVELNVSMVGPDREYPIAVKDTVRTAGYSGDIGAEYTLDGVPTGTTYPFPAGLSGMIDGTTDGTFNYAWDYDSGRAVRFTDTWTSPTVLFTIGNASGNRLGITYDGTNNSLWLSGWTGTTGNKIENYNLGGTLISSFTVAHNLNAALALDPADNTLWLNNRTTNGTSLTLEQYSKTGTLLNTQVFSGAPYTGYNVLGGEFQHVPEPGSALLLSAGGLALLLRRRRTQG